jgi:hypothetical protein
MNDANNSIFAKLDGTTAHILVILGLFLMLLSPLITRFRSASVARAGIMAEQTDDLSRLDLQELRDQQEEDRKKDSAANLAPEEMSNRERTRSTVMEQKQQELKKKYNVTEARRDYLTATADLAGTRTQYIASFLGALCMLIGLLVMTVQSEGTRQKVMLIILLVVMFSALPGISLSLEGKSNLGGSGGAGSPSEGLPSRPTAPAPSRP